MKTAIFSDVHLDPGPVNERLDQQHQEFIRFLHDLAAQDVRRVIILGDLFDFWFEYKHVVFSGYFNVLRAFAELREKGIELHLVCGNHDFWAGRFLENDLDFHIYRDPVTMEFDKQRVLFAHGDGLNKKDWGYRLYKRFARARLVIAAFGLLHPDLAMGIAKRVSRTSRRMLIQEDPAKGAEALALREFAKNALAEGKADVVMCGHAHSPLREEFPTPKGAGLYINTGDWMYHRSYAIWNGNDFELIQKRQL